MKGFFLSILAIFTIYNLTAQKLEITVVDSNKETLPFASIYINNILANVTDSEGIAYVTFDKLKYGDTISSTYIGMKSSYIIFDKQIHNESKCTIILDNNFSYELNPVLIKATTKDDWKFFHKNVNTYSTFLYDNCIVIGNFRAEVELSSDQIPQNIAGTFELKNIIPQKTKGGDFFKYYFAGLPEINPSLKDTVLSNKLMTSISRSINIACQSISRIHWEHNSNSKYSIVTYLGVNNNYNYFRIVYTDGKKGSPSYQILLSADKDNKEIKTISSNYYTRFLSADCIKSEFKKGNRRLVLTVPSEIEYNLEEQKVKSMIKLTLSSLTFQIVN